MKDLEGMVQLINEVIAVDQLQHPIKANYIDDLRARARDGLILKCTRRNCSQQEDKPRVGVIKVGLNISICDSMGGSGQGEVYKLISLFGQVLGKPRALGEG